MTGSPSILLTRKAVANETFIRKSNNLFESHVGIDASQLYDYSMCQDMPTGTTMKNYKKSSKIQVKFNFVRCKIWLNIFSIKQTGM